MHYGQSAHTVLKRFIEGRIDSRTHVEKNKVRTGLHDFAYNSVTKLNDGFNEFTFFVFNDLFFSCGFNDAQELLFANKRTLLQAFALHDNICQANQCL